MIRSPSVHNNWKTQPPTTSGPLSFVTHLSKGMHPLESPPTLDFVPKLQAKSLANQKAGRVTKRMAQTKYH